MATKAQQFRVQQARTHGKEKVPQKAQRALDPKHTDTRNVTRWGDKMVGPALEDSMSGRPSRKSTRPSSHHGRSDTQLMKTARDRSQSPKAQANRAKVARR